MPLQQVARPMHTFLRPWFQPEQPGPLIGLHVINTGQGSLWVDRQRAPRLVKAGVAGNITLRGSAAALSADSLPPTLTGFIEADDSFHPQLQTFYPALQFWYRLIFVQSKAVDTPPAPAGSTLRLLRRADAAAVAALGADSAWIHKTWGGPAGLAAGGHAWGAFLDGHLAAVACSFFVGDAYEDLGVVTARPFRRRGLSTACAAALCRDIWARGRTPSWTTSVENKASVRVADKLGFTLQRRDRLLLLNLPPPAPDV